MKPNTLVERLRGIIRVPVNDGAGLLDGKDFFERSFPTSNLAREAADEIERLTADAARLDFLDQCNARLNARFGTTYRWKLILNHNVNRLFIGSGMDVDLADMCANGLASCRDAIDAEMKRTAALTVKDGQGGAT